MAVCRPDANSNGQLKTREIAIRIPSSSIPDPSAIRVTLTSYRQMCNPSLISSYQLSCHLKNYLTANPGTTRVAFNARYDEDLLSQLLYKNAEDPYLGKKHNSGAQDARQMLLVRISQMLEREFQYQKVLMAHSIARLQVLLARLVPTPVKLM